MQDEQKNEQPEHIETDTSQLTPQTRPGMAGHEWRQQGPYLRCASCPLAHGVYVGVNRLLVGFHPNGEPNLKRVR